MTWTNESVFATEVSPAARWRLKSSQTLRALMEQEDVTVRQLASSAGLKAHSMIQQLRDGSRRSCTLQTADGIAAGLNTTRETLFAARPPGRRKRRTAHP